MGDPTSLINTLKETYAELTDPIYGKCLVIPAAEFGKAWDEQLRAEGHKIFQGTADRRAVFFIQLAVSKPSENESSGESSGGEKVVYDPSKEPQPPQKPQPWLGKSWTKDEDKELIKCVTLDFTDAEIAKRIPNRTEIAIKQRRQRLESHGCRGVLLSKKKGKGGRPKKTLIAAPGGSPVSSPTPIHEPEQSDTQVSPQVAEMVHNPPAPTPKTQPFTIHTTLCINLNVQCNDAFSVQNALRVLQEARRL